MRKLITNILHNRGFIDNSPINSTNAAQRTLRRGILAASQITKGEMMIREGRFSDTSEEALKSRSIRKTLRPGKEPPHL
jgi:hypothetical protein